MLKLTEIPVKSGARIIKMSVGNEFEKKILSMGIKKGSIIKVKKEGVTSDLTLYEVNGEMVSLRKDACEKIIVLKI